MTTRRTLLGLGAGMLALAACSGAGTGAAPKITLEDAWVRPPAGGRDIGAAYLTIRNDGGTDTLLGASSPLADHVQMHISKMENDMMTMREEQSVDVPAHASIAYAPGGRHLMMFGVKAGLKRGDKVPLTLHFARSGDVSTIATVGVPPAS